VSEEWERAFRDLTELELKEIYYESFDSEILKYKEVQPDLSKWLTMGRTRIQTDIDNRRERGWTQFQTYQRRAMEEPWKVWELPDGSPAVEVSFNVNLGEGLIVRGYVDIVKDWGGDRLTVNDLKTGNREKSSLQLGVYKVALNEVFGTDVKDGSFYYAKDDTYSKTFDLSVWSEEYLREKFEAMERGIDNRVFIANVGDFCGLCPAKAQCPDYNSVL
jgi:RecB family exonuclease